jgi:hypothetical protein
MVEELFLTPAGYGFVAKALTAFRILGMFFFTKLS